MKTAMNILKNNIKIITLILGIIVTSNIIVAQDGKLLFEDNCTSCHAMGMKVVGPDLTGIGERRTTDWIKSFVKNSTAMIEAGDPEAVKVFEENGKVPMSIFQNTFSEEELNAVVQYIVDYKAEAVVADATPTTPNSPSGTPAAQPMSDANKLLIFIIAVPLLLIIILLLSTVLRIMNYEKGLAGEEEKENAAVEFLTGKISDEVIEGHSYDGIMELNNGMPPWLKWLFYATIVFAVVYLIHFQFLKTGPTQAEEYEIEMAKAVEVYGDMDIVTIAIEPITDETSLATAKEIYDKNCAACHKVDGGGSVGPNLTDNFWKNGGSLEEVFYTIRNGVPGQPMVAWKGKINDKDMLAISTYIKNMKGTNPEGAKEPEGEEYKGE